MTKNNKDTAQWVQAKLRTFAAELRKLDGHLDRLGKKMSPRDSVLKVELYRGMAAIRQDLLVDVIGTLDMLSGLDESAARKHHEECVSLLARFEEFKRDWTRWESAYPRHGGKKKNGVPFVVQKNQPGTAEEKGTPSC